MICVVCYLFFCLVLLLVILFFFLFYFILCFFFFFFFSSRRRHTRLTCDWSSDVCSSDLPFGSHHHVGAAGNPRDRTLPPEIASRTLRLPGGCEDRHGRRNRRAPRVFDRLGGAHPRPTEGPVMSLPWTLVCSRCGDTRNADGLPGVCPQDGAPYLVKYPTLPPAEAKSLLKDRRKNMWRYREWLPLAEGEQPVTLGEGCTPLLPLDRLGRELGFEHLFVKDEGLNPTGSFKARGLAAAVSRAVLAGAKRFVVPTAGNAGVALSAYATRAGVSARVYAPATTPATILSQIKRFGADLQLVEGHIGDCGKAARAYSAETGAVDVSTLREPYRIEGKKTLGLELAEQMGWTLPDVIVYPTGGGTGLIGMW